MESAEHYEQAVADIAAEVYAEPGEGDLESVHEDAMAIESAAATFRTPSRAI